MLLINLNVNWPPWWERYRSLWFKSGQTWFRHKLWEIHAIEHWNLFRFEFQITSEQDHAGVNLELGLLGYEIHFTVYDDRHWDYEEDTWINDD